MNTRGGQRPLEASLHHFNIPTYCLVFSLSCGNPCLDSSCNKERLEREARLQSRAYTGGKNVLRLSFFVSFCDCMFYHTLAVFSCLVSLCCFDILLCKKSLYAVIWCVVFFQKWGLRYIPRFICKLLWMFSAGKWNQNSRMTSRSTTIPIKKGSTIFPLSSRHLSAVCTKAQAVIWPWSGLHAY